MWAARVLRKCGKTRETQNLNLEFLFHHLGPPREIIHPNKITQPHGFLDNQTTNYLKSTYLLRKNFDSYLFTPTSALGLSWGIARIRTRLAVTTWHDSCGEACSWL